MKQRTFWRYLVVFLAGVLLTTLVHWGWRLLATDYAWMTRSGGQATTTGCLPPFCDEADEVTLSRSRPHDSNLDTPTPPSVASDMRYVPGVSRLPFNDDLPSTLGGAVTDGTHQVCVVDPVGQSGRFAALLGQWQVAMMDHGVRPALMFYTNDRIAVEDYRAGKCSAVALPVTAAPELLPAVATLEAVRAVPTRAHARVLLQVLASGNPSMDALLKSDDAVLVGLLAAGNTHLLVSDASDVGAPPGMFVGMRVAVVNRNQQDLVALSGGEPLDRALVNAAGAFNNGTVQGVMAPAYRVTALELYKGIEKQGAVVAPPLYQSWYQLVAKPGYFSDDQIAAARKNFFGALVPQLDKKLEEDEGRLALLSTLTLSEDAVAMLDNQARQLRLAQRGKRYDANMLSLMRKVRCKLDASRAECVNPEE